MKITVDRKYKKPTYTIGKVYINCQYFCDSLEDKDRGLSQDMPEEKIFDIKVKGKTAIPYGIYTVTYTYSPKYRKYMLQINNVPGFAGIRIHSGNTHQDTEGCLLLGKNTKVGEVTNSRATVNEFNRIVKSAIDKQEKVLIEFV